MNVIKFHSTLKPDGKQYERIVFWNRFIRTKTETVLMILPIMLGIFFFVKGYRSTFMMVVYCIFFVYPLIAYRQFKSAVAYHLKNRDKSESAPCTFTLMDSGILCEFDDSDDKRIFKWEDFTTVYNRLGYYMFFQNNEMLVMLNQHDVPEELKQAVFNYIDSHIDHNQCIIK